MCSQAPLSCVIGSVDCGVTQGDFFFDVRPSEEKGGTIGYSFEVITEASAAGKVTLLDVDLDAAKRMKEMDKIEEAVYIFIQPPSVDILVERMK